MIAAHLGVQTPTCSQDKPRDFKHERRAAEAFCPIFSILCNRTIALLLFHSQKMSRNEGLARVPGGKQILRTVGLKQPFCPITSSRRKITRGRLNASYIRTYAELPHGSRRQCLSLHKPARTYKIKCSAPVLLVKALTGISRYRLSVKPSSKRLTTALRFNKDCVAKDSMQSYLIS